MKYEFVSDKPIPNFQQAIIPESITQAYTNLVQDPTDLTTGNWNKTAGLTAVDSSLTINGNRFTKIVDDSSISDSQISQNIPVTASVKHSAHVIIRNESVTDETVFFVLLSGENNQVNINWVTMVLTLSLGDSLKYNFIDNNTVEIWLITAGTSIGTSADFRIDPTNLALDAVIYITECQIVDNTTTFFPFIDGSKTADVIDESFTMPDKFTGRIRFTPNFAYDTLDGNKMVFSWRVSNTQRFELYYEEANDLFRLLFEDTGTGRFIDSQLFDDGTSLTNINQMLDIVFSVDLISGGQNDSRFIIIPQESGSLFEDDTFNSNPDIKTSDFPTLSIGHVVSVQQIDSSYEYVRIYEGLLIGTVTSSEDATELLKSMEMLFQASELPRENTYELNGTLTPTIPRGSFSRGTENITFQQKIIERSFLPGSVKIGDPRLQSRPMVFNQDFAFKTDADYDSFMNELIRNAQIANYIRDLTNEKQAQVALIDLSIPYDPGSIKRSGTASMKMEMIGAFWESVEDVESVHYLYAGTNTIIINNEGSMLTYPRFVFDVPTPASQFDIYVDETKEGLQLVDPTLGTPTLTELIIDCSEGILTIAGFDRTQNITDRTGYFPFQVGNNTLIVETPVDCRVEISFKKRSFL